MKNKDLVSWLEKKFNITKMDLDKSENKEILIDFEDASNFHAYFAINVTNIGFFYKIQILKKNEDSLENYLVINGPYSSFYDFLTDSKFLNKENEWVENIIKEHDKLTMNERLHKKLNQEIKTNNTYINIKI